jgi:UDP-N-acetylglucosamine acyltransferase
MIDGSVKIDKSAVIEDNVAIAPFTVIGANVLIKAGTRIGSNCFIEHAEIGRDCNISNSVSIGTPPQDISYRGEPSKAYIGDGTTLREFVTINRGTSKTLKTVIGKNCFFMACSHAAHDTRVGDNVILVNAAVLGGHAEVGDRAFLGGNSGVHQFCKVGKGVMVAGGSIITMDVIPYAMCYGDRAVLDGLNLVGMRRNKMSAADIAEVKNAYRLLFMSKLLLKDAMSELEKIDSPYVKEIVEFVKNSKRALVRPKGSL